MNFSSSIDYFQIPVVLQRCVRSVEPLIICHVFGSVAFIPVLQIMNGRM